MAISLPATKNDGSQIQSLFPLCILLARQVQIPVASKVFVLNYQTHYFQKYCVLFKRYNLHVGPRSLFL